MASQASPAWFRLKYWKLSFMGMAPGGVGRNILVLTRHLSSSRAGAAFEKRNQEAERREPGAVASQAAVVQ